jgi:hypothetical protein
LIPFQLGSANIQAVESMLQDRDTFLAEVEEQLHQAQQHAKFIMTSITVTLSLQWAPGCGCDCQTGKRECWWNSGQESWAQSMLDPS